MAAPKGNEFWMLRSKHGRDKLFATPELLWEAACEYFQWCDENPWTTRKATQKTVPVKVVKDKEIVIENQQQTQQEVTPTSRPYSLMGMCVYLGASTNWWNEFRSACINKRDKDFLEVIARVEETIKGTKSNPRWFVPLFCALMIIGLIWAVVYYLTSDYPIPNIGAWNLAIAFAIIMIGFIMTMWWR